MTERLVKTAQTILDVLKGYEPRRLYAPNSRLASVLVPMIDRGSEVEIIFTKRASHLPHHAGQISFPGGASDPDDGGASFTALRETCEEIGVCDGLVRVVTRLDQVITVTDFLVTPYLGMVVENACFNPNPVEVERLLLMPLAKVLDESNWGPCEVVWQEHTFNQQEGLNHDGEVIWGATARMLRNLRESLGPGVKEVIATGRASA
jgi:8-oxo-dGTP pyrophosphatase MutT (NUDIX family)